MTLTPGVSIFAGWSPRRKAARLAVSKGQIFFSKLWRMLLEAKRMRNTECIMCDHILAVRAYTSTGRWQASLVSEAAENLSTRSAGNPELSTCIESKMESPIQKKERGGSRILIRRC